MTARLTVGRWFARSAQGPDRRARFETSIAALAGAVIDRGSGVVLTVAATFALAEPARLAGRPMRGDVARALARASGGYPYAIQLYGHHAWRASSGQREIDLGAAERALPRAERELGRGLYANRMGWRVALPAGVHDCPRAT